MAKHSRKAAAKTRRHRRGRKGGSRRVQRAGGLGHTYSFGGPVGGAGYPIGNTAEVIPGSSCLAATRPGLAVLPTTGLGLPGMSGGGRRGRTQRGGRYTVDVGAGQLAPATPFLGGYPVISRIPCEGSTPNPLNPGPHTPSTQPPIRGGGGTGTPFLEVPTAGYTNQPSTWVGSTGAPSLLQIPVDARTMSSACLKTGGGRRRRGRKAAKRRITRRR
jgi:hypothetical protein